MDDNFFDLPDEGAPSDNTTNNLLNNSIFANTKKPIVSKSIDNILATLPVKSETIKKSSVTFKEPLKDTSLSHPASSNTSEKIENFSTKFYTEKQKTQNIESEMHSSSPMLNSSIPSTKSTPFSTSDNIGSLFGTRRNRLRDQSDDSSRLNQMDNTNRTPIANDSIISVKEKEIEELRKELSSLRYEQLEKERIINELRLKADIYVEENRSIIDRLNEQHKKELNDLNNRYEREKTEIRENLQKDIDVFNSLIQNQSQTSKLEAEISHLKGIILTISNKLESLVSNVDVTRIVDFARSQIQQHEQVLEKQKKEWERHRDSSIAQTREELSNLAINYEKEIIEGRKWIEAERERMRIDRLAFQQEQMSILDVIEKKREELNIQKSEFFDREHDLLIRIVNEKAIMEQQRHEFENQRHADVSRLRQEAQHLERCLIQVANAQRILANARNDYDRKLQRLNDLKEMLMKYERTRLRKTNKTNDEIL